MSRPHIAVLLTCHNRRALTLSCLTHLAAQDADCDVTLFLVDDGSSDGTADVVRRAFPESFLGTHILEGDGNLYWCGGMRLAFAAARAAGTVDTAFDFDLWLNDDTFLHPDALSRLLATHRQLTRDGNDAAIVVGSTTDPRTGRLSYGGMRRLGPLPYTVRVPPTERPQRCSTLNGNCVLLPRAATERIGNLDPDLTHGRGDIDYGLRATALGCGVWVAPGFHGTCEGHPTGAWRDLDQPLRQRFAALQHPKYAIAEKVLVARRHYGPLWFLSPLAVYAYIVLSHPVGWLRRRATRSAR